MLKKLAIVLCILSPVPRSVSFSQTQDPKESDLLGHLVSLAEQILADHAAEQSTPAIAPGARLVFGSRNVDLRDVVSGRDTSITLVERPSHQPIALHLKTNESEDTAYLLLTTATPSKEPRFHTVVFMKDKAGVWRIETWHASP